MNRDIYIELEREIRKSMTTRILSWKYSDLGRIRGDYN